MNRQKITLLLMTFLCLPLLSMKRTIETGDELFSLIKIYGDNNCNETITKKLNAYLSSIKEPTEYNKVPESYFQHCKMYLPKEFKKDWLLMNILWNQEHLEYKIANPITLDDDSHIIKLLKDEEGEIFNQKIPNQGLITFNDQVMLLLHNIINKQAFLPTVRKGIKNIKDLNDEEILYLEKYCFRINEKQYLLSKYKNDLDLGNIYYCKESDEYKLLQTVSQTKELLSYIFLNYLDHDVFNTKIKLEDSIKDKITVDINNRSVIIKDEKPV